MFNLVYIVYGSASNNISFTPMPIHMWFVKNPPPPQAECTPLLVSNHSFDGRITMFANLVDPKLPYPL